MLVIYLNEQRKHQIIKFHYLFQSIYTVIPLQRWQGIYNFPKYTVISYMELTNITALNIVSLCILILKQVVIRAKRCSQANCNLVLTLSMYGPR